MSQSVQSDAVVAEAFFYVAGDSGQFVTAWMLRVNGGAFML